MARIVAWYVPDWHTGGNGPEWQTLKEPLSGHAFAEHVGQRDDEHADEGTFAEGHIRLDDGREMAFSIEKEYSVDYYLNVDDDAEGDL